MRKLKLFTFFVCFLVFQYNANAQNPVTAINVNAVPATPSAVGPENWGQGDDLILISVEEGGLIFNYNASNTPDKLEFIRVDNANSTGTRSRLMAQRINNTNYSPTYPVAGPDGSTMEDALLSPIINRGALDIFHNVNLNNQNANNIERIDVLYSGVDTPGAALLNEIGFLVSEKFGNNGYKLAAVTSVDALGNPTSYGPLITVDAGDYGIPNPALLWRFLENAPNPPHGDPAGYGGSSEGYGFSLVTLQDLGVAANTTIYGISLFGIDVTGTGGQSLLDPTTFPQNTTEGADVHGALGALVQTVNVLDSDDDGIPDVTDLDDDNDGIIDVLENLSADLDNDMLQNSLDLDSDSDGISDTDEYGVDVSGVDFTADSDTDGIPDAMDATSGGTDLNGNGIIDSFEPIDTDGDTSLDYLDLDSDNDGIYDTVEAGLGAFDNNNNGQFTANAATDTDGNGMADATESNIPTSTDGDSIPDYLDLDSDNDGIPDNIEAQTTLGYIAPNGDAGPATNGLDSAYPSAILPINTDGVDNPDYLDLDSDNEGGNDTTEGGLTLAGNVGANGLDSNSENIDDYSDVNGSFDDTQTDNFPDADADVLTTGDVDWRDIFNNDFDNDGIPDFVDLDDDNDGIPDTEEGLCAEMATFNASSEGWYTINNNDNALVQSNPASHSTDAVTGVAGCPIDMTGASNAVLAGMSPTGTNYIIEADGNGGDNFLRSPNRGGINLSPLLGGTLQYDAYDYKLGVTGNPGWVANPTGNVFLYDTAGNFVQASFPITNEQLTNWENGIWNTFSIAIDDASWSGTQQDLINILNDYDYVSIQMEFILASNPAVCGASEYFAIDNFGITNTYNASLSCDFDNDGLPNAIDLDSDNDGIADIIEAGGTDANGDGMVDGFTDADNDGLNDAQDNLDNGSGPSEVIAGTPHPDLDTDGDNLPNRLDLDSDNDGIHDVIESGGVDTDGNGRADDDDDNLDNTGSNGIPTSAGGGNTPTDTGSDMSPDYINLDSDNDGCSDANEAYVSATADEGDGGQYGTGTPAATDANGLVIAAAYNTGVVAAVTDATDVTACNNLDSDGDGITDDVDIDDDNDGILDTVEGSADTDGDGIIDALDLDSDNDGIPDIIEAGGVDTDGDGQVDFPTPGDPMSMNDINNDGLDDDVAAAPLPDTDSDNDGLVDRLDLDSDNDGIADIIEAGGTDANSDGEVDYATPGDATTMLDADGDGFIDTIDTDDNTTAGVGDGGTALPDADTDGDSFPNRLDLDSDNDGIHDVVESGGIDSDGNGRADDDDDNVDNTATNGIPTTAGGGNTPTDTGSDGSPDYLNLDSDADGCSDANEAYFSAIADGSDGGQYGTGTPAAIGPNGLVTAAAYDTGVVISVTDDTDTTSCIVIDTDGDGVIDDQEAIDMTDPNDPCDFLIASITEVQSGDYLVADCDGDGVLNGTEITDGTNPDDPCDFIEASITLSTSGDWLTADCDGDTIPNGQEITDGTDPYDPCSSIGGIPPAGSNCDTNVSIETDLVNPGVNGGVFQINNIESYPNTVRIYNRWGILVFETDGYDNNTNAFRGTSNGRSTINADQELPVGIYFYIIDYVQDGQSNTIDGYLYVNR